MEDVLTIGTYTERIFILADTNWAPFKLTGSSGILGALKDLQLIIR